jgi:hypothetical protein
MQNIFRHIALKRIITAFLLPFVLVYANGSAVAWCIYLWEWEDIVTHYCQAYSTEECDGKAFVNAVLEKKDNRYPALPHAPQNIQELRSTAARFLHVHLIHYTTHQSSLFEEFSSPHRGYLRDVFRPPCVLLS